MSDNFIADPDSQYGDGIMVDEYNGTISLVLAKTGSDGNAYKQWCHPQGWDGEKNFARPKAIPWKVKIGGDKKSAVLMLGRLAKLVDAMGDDEDDPFA